MNPEKLIKVPFVLLLVVAGFPRTASAQQAARPLRQVRTGLQSNGRRFLAPIDNIGDIMRAMSAQNHGLRKTLHIQGQISLDVTTTGSTCDNGHGQITVSASGGTAPYTYSLSDGTTNQTGDFTYLLPGTYTITVTDASGLTAAGTAVVTNTFEQPKLTASYSNASSCIASDASVTLLATGGTPPYQYSMDNVTYQNGNVFSNLSAGDYLFFVKDANGCINVVNSFSLGLLNGHCSIPAGFDYSGIVCGNTGEIDITMYQTASGPFTYSLDDGINFQPANVFFNVPPGIHRVYIRDGTGALFEVFAVTIFNSCPFLVTATETDADCGHANGVVTLTVTDGTPPYAYSIDGVNYQTGNVFTGLAPGSYSFTVTDATGGSSVVSATVSDRCPTFSLSAVSATCNTSNGTITVTPAKGQPPFQYSLNNGTFQAGNVFSGLAAGKYKVSMKDRAGFVVSDSIAIVNGCIFVNTSPVNSTCSGSNGKIFVSAASGTPPFSYSIDGTNFQPADSFTNLLAGDYLITVRDNAGSMGTSAVTVGNAAGPSITLQSTDASCLNNDGTLAAAATGGTRPFRFSVDGKPFQDAGFFSGLDTGQHHITIQDANGCLASGSAVITLQPDLTVTMPGNPTICEGAVALLQPLSNGISFAWTPSSSQSDPNSLASRVSPAQTTTYYLQAVRGICFRRDSVTVFVHPAPIANAGPDTTICYGQSVRLAASGGMKYLWSPATYLDNTSTRDPNVVKPGSTISYSLAVIDANNCQSLRPSVTTVVVTPPAKVFVGNDTVLTIGEQLQLKAVDVNGSGFLQYIWSPAYGLSSSAIQDPVLTGDKDITYSVRAVTAAGCEGVDQVSIRVFPRSDIFVPSGFTPNGDGLNDLLKAIPVGIMEFKYFAVYNRWGRRIFYTTDPSIGWNGVIDGIAQQTTTYVWITAGIDFKGNLIEKKGPVTLIR